MVKKYINDYDNIKSNEILSKYLKEINKEPLLTAEEEKKLIKEIEEGNEKAREKLLKSHLKLVVIIAKNFTGYGIPLQDLISEGNIGLIKAVGKFDASKGVRFSTYASWWIKQSIKRAILNNSKIIRLPVHAVLHTNGDTSHDFYNANNRKEAAKEIGIDINKIEGLIITNQETLSYNQSINGDDNFTFEEIISNSETETPFDSYEKKEIIEKILNWLSYLNEKERTVIILRFGLINQHPMTLDEVGNVLNLTKERIRQIEDKALKKLKFYLNKHKKELLKG